MSHMKKEIGLAGRNRHSRPVFVLLGLGLFLTILWWWNATLVYDDVILTLKDSSPYGFNYLVDRDGWFATLLHFLCLDLPDQYRTYGLSRSLQFILWSVGVSSAKSYSLIISSTHVASVLVLYFLLLRIGRSAHDALIFCVIWLLSPYVWTSCFHHYSYLALPTQILIVGSFLLLILEPGWRKSIFAAALGVVCGLTGELHLIAVCIFLWCIASVVRSKSFAQAAIVTVFSMVAAIVVHHLMWKIFESDPTLRPRFALSLSHDWPYWSFRILAAVRSIYFAFAVPVNEMDFRLTRPFLFVMFGASLVAFAMQCWVNREWIPRKEENKYKKDIIFFISLVFIALSYFAIYMVVVILSDSIPHTMPRRYGYMSLTVLLVAVVGILLSLVPWPRVRTVLVSLTLGGMATVFLAHQIWMLPEIRFLDMTLTQKITEELQKNPDGGVLFFNASSKDFPRNTIWPDSYGPAMQNNEGTEYTQATYGTYWPAEMEATRFSKAKFACDIGRVLPRGKVEVACPYGNVKRHIDSLGAVVVANLGYTEKDTMGHGVRVFSSLNEFIPYYFSRKIMKEDIFKKMESTFFIKRHAFDFPGQKTSNDTQLVVHVDRQTPSDVSDEELSESVHHHEVGANIGKDGRALIIEVASNEFSLNMKKTDVDVFLKFEVPPKYDFKKYLQNTYVSWSGEAWVSLGDDYLNEVDLIGEVVIRLSRLDSTKFSIVLPGILSNEQGAALKSLGMTAR